MVALSVVAGCGPEVDTTLGDALEPGVHSLIDHLAWTSVSEPDDPLADHRPEEVDCPDGAWYEEDGALDAQTGFCTYLAISQPSLASVALGDQLDIVLWHANLGAGDGAPAHVAVVLGETVIWEAHVEMPADATVFHETLSSPVKLAEGEAVGLHLHNHGFNAWTFLSLEVSR